MNVYPRMMTSNYCFSLSVLTIVDAALPREISSRKKRIIDQVRRWGQGRAHLVPAPLSPVPKQGAVDRRRFGLMGRRSLWVRTMRGTSICTPRTANRFRKAQPKFVTQRSVTPLGIGGPTHSCMHIRCSCARITQGTKKSTTNHPCRNPGKDNICHTQNQARPSNDGDDTIVLPILHSIVLVDCYSEDGRELSVRNSCCGTQTGCPSHNSSSSPQLLWVDTIMPFPGIDRRGLVFLFPP
jgi:hypothetical protein